ncbi:L-lactate MFS transporter [Alkaliphilus transvaalensis]|uniref:L-lactate MFS transporter n=1 Tax=Alkaliphilus transvaalensis TaxID=114628 RepID=UPI000478C72E|nr:OFA family MFS transporter [Alkaliphilus transvaalensis]
MTKKNFSKAWLVTIAALGVNLTLGVLYAWSIIAKALISELGWTATQTQIPYMAACAFFAFSMVPGGKFQDKLGPKPVIMTSAVLAAIGFFFSGIFLSVPGLTIFFGVIFGTAMGTGYAATTPAAVKWFNSKKRGLISGIVVSGFGLAPVYIAPLTETLINRFGIKNSFFLMSGGFFTIIMILVQAISNPPKDYVVKDEAVNKTQQEVNAVNYNWREVLKTKQFYLLWTMFCFGTFAGLLLTGQLARIGIEQAGFNSAYTLIAIYAVANFSGRIGCGVISDKLGRMKTLFLTFALQVIIFMVFSKLTTPLTLMFGTAVVGFTFGGAATLFPTLCIDYYGMKNFGMNYGMIITAWGIGGVFGPLLGGLVRDYTGGYAISYTTSALLSVLGALLCLITKSPNISNKKTEENLISVKQG